MRIERAIDAYLAWRELERDSPPRTIDSYRRILDKLADRYPEAQLASFDGREGTERLREFLKWWADWSMRERDIRLSAATRSNIISVLHSFFGWAEAEDLVEADPSRRIQRPPKRRPKINRPQPADLSRLREAATLYEIPAVVLMEGAGLRQSEVLACRWQDIDLLNGRVQIHRKGNHWDWLPLAPDVTEILRDCFRKIGPDLDDHVFTVEVELWASQHHRVRRRKDPKSPASPQSIWRMVKRVAARAGVAELSPHPLRHGFANRFLRESGRDLVTLQALMGHSRPDTTQKYTDELTLEEQSDALRQAVERRAAQASPDLATPGEELSSTLESEEWRRRESNPRPSSYRKERLQA